MKTEIKVTFLIFLFCFLFVPRLSNATTFVVSNTNDSGIGSLRQAILNSNAATPGPNIINCPITGTITLITHLPSVDLTISVNGPSSGVLAITKTGFGGALFYSGAVIKPVFTFNDLTFLNLYLTNAVSNRGGLFMNRCVFRNNDHCRILDSEKNVALNNCSFYANTDCICLFYPPASISGSLINNINQCVFYNNTSVVSGLSNCISSQGACFTVSNCTFANNSAYTGAALYFTGFSNGKSKAINCTFYGNVATTGNGGAIYTNNFRSIRLENCILVGNSAFSQGPDMFGIDSSANGHNIISNTSGIVFRGSTAGNITGVAAASVINTTLANNGGLTKTLALLSSGPAVNAASTILAPPADQRNYIRLGNPDIGAFEFGTNTPLPLDLLSFTGTYLNNQAELIWSTASEKQVDRFILESSTDKNNWHFVNFITAKGNTNQYNYYAYSDKDCYSGINYYRLSQQDEDGLVYELKTIALKVNPLNQLLVYPTLVNNKKIFITYNESFINLRSILITDLQGKRIWSQQIEKDFYSSQTLEIILPEGILTGIYLVKIMDDSMEYLSKIKITD